MIPTRTLMSLPQWALSTEGAVLALLAAGEGLTQRDLAERLNLTERSAHRVIGALEQRGCIQKVLNGRRLNYIVAAEIGEETASAPSLWQRLRAGGGR